MGKIGMDNGNSLEYAYYISIGLKNHDVAFQHAAKQIT